MQEPDSAPKILLIVAVFCAIISIIAYSGVLHWPR
jgi:hypothetical protein